MLESLSFWPAACTGVHKDAAMKFITTPFVFLVGALILIGVVHGDLWIAFSRFSSLGAGAKAGCLFATFAGFFAALLRD